MFTHQFNLNRDKPHAMFITVNPEDYSICNFTKHEHNF